MKLADYLCVLQDGKQTLDLEEILLYRLNSKGSF